MATYMSDPLRTHQRVIALSHQPSPGHGLANQMALRHTRNGAIVAELNEKAWGSGNGTGRSMTLGYRGSRERLRYLDMNWNLRKFQMDCGVWPFERWIGL